MSEINIKVPSMGEGITDVTITRWLVEEGETIEAEHPIVEVATDKVDSEIIAPEEGVILKTLKKEGDIVAVGEVLAILGTNNFIGNKHDVVEVYTTEKKQKEKNSEIIDFNEEVQHDIESELNTYAVRKHRFIPPFIRTLANEYNISIDELYSIKGTRANGEINLEDVKKYVLRKNSTQQKEKYAKVQKFSPIVKSGTSLMVDDNHTDNTEIIEMDKMRKLIAEHMVRSKMISPHVTSFIETDVTNLVTWRNSVKDEFQEKVGEKLTYTPLFIEAVVKALKKFSMLNASVDNNKIYIKKNINIGVATALTDGNLIVPVIKDSDKKNLTGLAKEVNDIVRRARQNKLNPSEIKGGTFTITNLGNFESLAGTPIINQPEVAILAIGAITRKPAVVKVNEAETIGIRDIVMLSLAYDHRIIDGSLGGMFLKYIRDTLQDYDINRHI